MSEANRTDLSYIKEVTPGVTPSAGNYKKIPYTAAPDFSFNPSTVQSAEIRSDRQVDDLPLVGIEAGGSIDFELAHGRFDELLSGAFYNDWDNLDEAVGADVSAIKAGTLSFTVDNKIPSSLKTGTLIKLEDAGAATGVYVVGNIRGKEVAVAGLPAGVKGSAFKVTVIGIQLDTSAITHTEAAKTIAVNNAVAKTALVAKNLQKGDWIVLQPLGFFRVVSAASGAGSNFLITYDQIIAKTKGYGVNLPAAKSNFLFSNGISNGVTKKSYSILQRFQSLVAPNQAVFSGCRVDELSLSLDTQSIITGSFAFLGLNSRFLAVNIADNLVKEAPAGKILTSSNNVAELFVGGEKVTSPNYVQSAGLNIANNARRQNAVGSVGSVGIVPGNCVVTGNLSTYFGDKSLAEKVVENAESSFASVFVDDPKDPERALLVDVPRLKFSSGSVGVEGGNTDLILPLEFQALRHALLGYQIKIASFPQI